MPTAGSPFACLTPGHQADSTDTANRQQHGLDHESRSSSQGISPSAEYGSPGRPQSVQASPKGTWWKHVDIREAKVAASATRPLIAASRSSDTSWLLRTGVLRPSRPIAQSVLARQPVAAAAEVPFRRNGAVVALGVLDVATRVPAQEDQNPQVRVVPGATQSLPITHRHRSCPS